MSTVLDSGLNIMDRSVLVEVGDELRRARAEHDNYNSLHEAYAVIKEELDEFWEEVRKKTAQRSAEQCRTELVQIACTAVRAVNDLALSSGLAHSCCGKD
jgi:uncharacterized protein YydD (DUF2326 family)